MEFYDYLLNRFGYNEPFFTHDIEFGGYSKPWIYRELNILCGRGDVFRYEKGVYYIPDETPLGKTRLDPRKVIYKKYIRSGDEYIGYFTGNTLLNLLGLSPQVPNTIEVCTNAEKTKLREISVGKQSVILRRARTGITNDNVRVLQFLELMNTVSPSCFDEGRKETIRSYVRDNGISRRQITEYAPCFPDRAMRNLIESEIIYDVAQ